MNSCPRGATRAHRPALLALGLAAAASCVLAASTDAAPGNLDRGFGHNGRVIADLGIDDQAVAVAGMGNRKTITAGTVVIDGAKHAVIARFQADGNLDATFGDGGRVILELAGEETAVSDVAVADNGRTLLSATIHQGDGRAVGVARLRRDGSLDPTFGTEGVTVLRFDNGPASLSAGIAIAEDGKIVVSGVAGGNFGVGRLTVEGQPDQSFSEDGREVTDLGGTEWVTDVAIGPGGAIVAAGLTGEEVIPNDPDGWNEDLALARYLPEGGLDPGFSGDGVETWGLSGPDESANAIAVLDDGSTVAAGSTADGGTSDTTLVRFGPDGGLDASFGTDGARTVDLAGRKRDRRDGALAVAVDDTGRVLVGGFATTGARRSALDFGLARFRHDGRLDRRFGDSGRVTTDLGGRDVAVGLALDSRGAIVLAGSTVHRGSRYTGLARYRAR